MGQRKAKQIDGAEQDARDIASWRGEDGASVAQVRRQRASAWTERVQADFIANLAVTANVSASAAAVGKSLTCVYERRRRSPSFRSAWAEALAEGYARLEAMLLDRALNGRRVAREVGGVTVEHVEYSDSLALNLLTQHRRAVAEQRAAQGPAREDPLVVRARMARLIEKLVGQMPDRPAALPAAALQIVDQPPVLSADDTV